ncbi:hypothetical protein Dred_0805 [Desulforamulus reducens MI-1]|uniref:Type II secretion system protein GspF domain-containing protein n=1 Tax=Desulforamulus reducens (strain ATCC BAA-1160 / DSM 100696 / MI-1) TaxID=349161 RepID=A4J2P0_DESRM|nr:hypothetical protein [Desulforamulus reducens]ABO49343.1 hypothetical protein Dred_0805 [Desulforamulus reducens MI-1]
MWVSLFAFLAVVCLGIGIIYQKDYSKLKELLSGKSSVKVDDKSSILDELWGTPPDTRKATLNQAMVGLVLGFMAGEFISSTVALLLAPSGFVLGPRIYELAVRGYKRKKFRTLFTRAVSDMAVVARNSTILEGIAHVAENAKPPVSDIFSYISESIQKGEKDYLAIIKAAEVYNVPELLPLADSVRIIADLGGGKRAPEILTSAAEMVKHQNRFIDKVNIAVSEMLWDAAISMLILVACFAWLALPEDSVYRLSLSKHPMLLAAGFGSLIICWVFIFAELKKFKSKCGL